MLSISNNRLASLWAVLTLPIHFAANSRSAKYLVFATLLSPVLVAQALPFNMTNILVTESNVLSEYTLSGGFVQSFNVPHPDTTRYDASDIVVTAEGAAVVRNSAPFDNDYFSRLDPVTGMWSHYSADRIGFGNVSDADLSLRGSIAVTNGRELNLENGVVSPFTVPGFRGVGEVSWGLDGLLYALDSGSPRHGVRVLDPTDFSLLRQLTLLDWDGFRIDARGIAVTKLGQMFVADWDGMIYEYTPDATLVQSKATGAFNLLDINLDEQGTLIAGSRFGEITVTDTSLSSMFNFNVGGGLSYVSFARSVPAAVPTPTTLALFGLGLAGLVFVRRKKV